MNSTIQFSVVEVYINPWEAHVARALLESEGIVTHLGSEHIVTAWWPMSLGFGGVRLQVRTEDVERARAVLALRDNGELEAALVEAYPMEPTRCKRCGSDEFISCRSWPAILLAGMLLFFARATFPPAKEKRCKLCAEPSSP